MTEYRRYRFKAEVDWVEMEYRFPTPTQARYAVKGANWVIGLDQDGKPFEKGLSNTSTCHFWIRFNAPRNFRDLIEKVELYNTRHHPNTVMGDLTAIEISLDAYLRDNAAEHAEDELVTLGAMMAMHNTRHPGPNKRLYRDFKGSGLAIPVHIESLKAKLAKGYMLGIGNKFDDHFLRGYFKVSDTVDKERVDLPIGERRARFEASLRGGALPCRTLAELERLNFAGREGVSQYFKFRAIDDHVEGLLRLVAERMHTTGQLSQEGIYDKRTTDVVTGAKRVRKVVFRPESKSNSSLNKVVSEALRRLTKRWT